MKPTIPDLWGCIPTAERTANRLFGGPAYVGSLWVLRVTIDVVFQVSFPSWWERRLAAYKANYAIEEDTITIEGEEIEVYLVNRQWMIDVGNCIQDGGCSISEPRCRQFDFPG